jgi:hypothetical protein
LVLRESTGQGAQTWRHGEVGDRIEGRRAQRRARKKMQRERLRQWDRREEDAEKSKREGEIKDSGI